MYNYGSPRVGNMAFVKRFNRLVPDAWRVYNARDLVCSVPRMMGFAHVGTPVELQADGSYAVRREPSSADQLTTARGRTACGICITRALLPAPSCSIAMGAHRCHSGVAADSREILEEGGVAADVLDKLVSSTLARIGSDGPGEDTLLDRLMQRELELLNSIWDGRHASPFMQPGHRAPINGSAVIVGS